MVKKNNKSEFSRFRNKTDFYDKMINIIITVIIAGFLLYNIIAYLMDTPVASYEIQQGTIVTNNVYKGLILRDETVVYADQSGYINYYIKSGSKAAVTDPIYSIDTTGDISSVISAAAENGTTLDTGARNSLLTGISSFTTSYDSGSYETVYSFKQDFASELNQDFSTTALNKLDSTILAQANNSTFFLHYPETPGIIAYYVDGYEDLDPTDYTSSDMDSTGYKKEVLDSRTEVVKSDPVYKIVTSEEWNIIINISSELAGTMDSTGNIGIRFCKDDFNATANYTLERDGSTYYLNLKLKTGMIRYLTDRYTEIELADDQTEGLKIPQSAIVTDSFYAVPADCCTEGDKTTQRKLLVCGTDGDPVSTSFRCYYHDDQYCYFSQDDLPEGTVLQYPDSQDTYTVGSHFNSETGNDDGIKEIQGVYNINKGYTIFEVIHVLSSNDEYAVIENSSNYSVSLYDHIALDASNLKEGDLIN